MKKYVLLPVITLLLLSAKTAQADGGELKRLTIGIGAGYSYLFETPQKAFLTTDAVSRLQVQDLSTGNFVVSSVLVFRFTKLEVSDDGHLLASDDSKKAAFHERLSLNLAVNLLEVTADDVAFNKTIDGGIGVGIFVSPSMQLSISYDAIRHRQLKDYYINNYLDKPIPNGNSFFNALDESNNDLYFNKVFFGVSVKAIFSIGNKK